MNMFKGKDKNGTRIAAIGAPMTGVILPRGWPPFGRNGQSGDSHASHADVLK